MTRLSGQSEAIALPQISERPNLINLKEFKLKEGGGVLYSDGQTLRTLLFQM